MEIQIELAELRKKKIFVATPMYGGMCHGMYTKASCDLAKISQAYEMDVKMFYLFNESLITRARNYCVDEFLRSDYTHMMFIDSDIGLIRIQFQQISEGDPKKKEFVEGGTSFTH